MKQHVRFCTGTDGLRLAYAVHGSGPPLVRVATWLSHLASTGRVRYGATGLGGSASGTCSSATTSGAAALNPNIGDPSLDVWVGDLEAVVDALNLERFTLLMGIDHRILDWARLVWLSRRQVSTDVSRALSSTPRSCPCWSVRFPSTAGGMSCLEH